MTWTFRTQQATHHCILQPVKVGLVIIWFPRECLVTGNVDLARVLLNANCDIHIKNAKGHQAIHSAASNGFFDVVLLLVQHGAPWRQKGDMDVAKMLCRKSNLMASYVDGRLRIAERAKHRKAKPAESSESLPTEEELKQKQAQADAVMAELLAEEEKEKKHGDHKQRNKKNKDKKKKNQSSNEPKKDLPQKVKESPQPSEKVLCCLCGIGAHCVMCQGHRE